MFGPGTTAAAIDAFESRFTSVGGAHFLIAANGREAYPLGEAESLALRERYRRRMGWARWIRRAALFGFIPLTIMIATLTPHDPRWLREAFQTAELLALFGLPLFGLAQHPIVSDLTKLAIERPLKRRITTRYAPAVTPAVTRLGAFAKKLLITAFAMEVAIMLYHSFGPREELAAYLRMLYGLPSGNEGWAARFAGSLSRILQYVLVTGALLLMLDRRNRRIEAKRAAAPDAGPSAPGAKDPGQAEAKVAARLRLDRYGSAGNDTKAG